MKIENYGSGGRTRELMRCLLSLDGEGGAPPWVERIIILPIPTSRDGVHITDTDRLICEVLSDISPGDFVAGYAIPPEDVEIVEAQGGVCFDASGDGVFLRENARISALGALGTLLTSCGASPEDLAIGVVGYGRIGAYLTEMLMYHGGRVIVYTSNNATRLRLGELGVPTLAYDRGTGVLPEVGALDVLINTAPIPLGATFPEGIGEGLTVIELASGNNFAGVEGVVRLPSIPDRLYPTTAGRIYFEAVKRAMWRCGV